MLRTTFSRAWLAAALLLTTQGAFAQQKTATTTGTSSAERDLRSFVNWVGEKMDHAENSARREWPAMMADYDRQSQRLDKAVDSLSVQSRREYATQKSRYQSWAATQQQLESQAHAETPAQAQARLLNEQVSIARLRPTELPDLYERLVGYTREHRRQWTADDWATASDVLTRLNARYEQVRLQISLQERLRVRSLQGEFRTLETARATKDYLRDKEE